MRRFLGVMAILAIATPAFAADVLTGAQPVDFGAVPTLNRVNITVNPITGEQQQTTTTENRQGKVVSYESMNLAVARYFYPPLPGEAFADDLLLDKSSGKLLMNRYETYTYVVGPGDNVKIDFYTALSGPYLVLPSVAGKFLTVSGSVPAGLALIDITFDPPIPKDDFIWVSFQNENGLAGQLLAEVQQTVGDGFLEGPAGNGFFFVNADKDNDLGWNGAFYFGPNPPGPRGDFLQRVWNSPEPTTMALAGGALVAFFRRRR